MPPPFFTIGHSTRTIEAFVELLRVGEALAAYQVAHGRISALGGLRSRVREVPPERNGWWENRSFHNYADHALSEEFRAGLESLVALGRGRPVAMMCSEAVWWRCHRRIVADHLLARGETVFHLMDGGRANPARLSEGACVEDGKVSYPARPGGLPRDPIRPPAKREG